MSPAGQDEPGGLIEGILEAGERQAAPGSGSELLTFLFGDIRGYTHFTQQHGDEAAAKLTAKFAAIVRDLIVGYGGTVFELRGDEAMCVFTSARQSLRFAVALQQRFVTETASDQRLPMTVGIGVDAGEAVRSEDGFRGGALNLAARLCSEAKAGDVLASPEITHLARAVEGIRYVALDKVALKGISAPVRPVRVLPEGEDPAQQIAALIASARRPIDAASVPWLPGWLAHLSRRALTSIAVVLILLIAAVVVGVAQLGGGSRLNALGENSAGVIDTGNGHLVADVGVDEGPHAAATGFGSVWTANTGANTVSRIDPASRRTTRTFAAGAAPSAVAVGLQAVWVTNGDSATVSRIDPVSGEVTSIPVGTSPAGIAVVGDSVWVTNAGDGTVSRIDPAQNKVADSVEVGASPSGISAGRDIWVANSGANTVTQIDGRTHKVVQTVHVGNDPRGIAVLGDSVWVANALDGTVARIPTDGTSVADTVRVGSEPTQVAAVRDRIWVTAESAKALLEIDPRSARVVRTVPVGVIPTGLTAVGKQLWVTTTINPSRHLGGTIHILARDVGNVDPVYAGAVWTYWLINGTYDGLVGFRHAAGAAGTTVVPDLARAIPEPTNGGRTYAFQLRSGIRFSTGQLLTVDDVKRGLQRSIASGFTPLKQEIAGAATCTVSRCEISGIVVDPSADSITITLLRPSSAFLQRLASSTVAVPAKTPLAEQPSPIPGTGPYQIKEFFVGKRVLLTRNQYFHEWSAAAQPAGFPDSIEYKVDPSGGTKPGVALVAAGKTDWADARGAGQLGALEARFGDRLRVTPSETTHGVMLNTRVAPFDDIRVRRALAYAIDRDAVAADWFAPAAVTCQSDPPDFPGHRPYCPYTLRPSATGTWNALDLSTALKLVDASGTRGMRVTLYTQPIMAAGLRHVVAALGSLGYRARLVTLTRDDYFAFIADSRNKVQGGFFGWVADSADASNFFAPQFRCSGFSAANPLNDNPSEFCDHAIDRLMDQADKLQESTPAAASAVWAQVDRRVVDAAPWIPLVSPTWADVLAPRVHNYQRSPVLGVFFDQMWVN